VTIVGRDCGDRPSSMLRRWPRSFLLSALNRRQSAIPTHRHTVAREKFLAKDRHPSSIRAAPSISRLRTALVFVQSARSGPPSRRRGFYFRPPPCITLALVTSWSPTSRTTRRPASAPARRFHTPDDEGGAWIVCTNCLVPPQRPDGKPLGGPNGEPPDYGQRRRDNSNRSRLRGSING
jgi:hypothetical protein